MKRVYVPNINKVTLFICLLHVCCILNSIYVDIDGCCSTDDNGSDVHLTVCNPILFWNIDDPFGNSKPSVSVKDPSLTKQINKVTLTAKVKRPTQPKSRKLEN